MNQAIVDLMHSDLIAHGFVDALNAAQLETIDRGECQGYTEEQVTDAIMAQFAVMIGMYIMYHARGDEVQMRRDIEDMSFFAKDGMLLATKAMEEEEGWD